MDENAFAFRAALQQMVERNRHTPFRRGRELSVSPLQVKVGDNIVNTDEITGSCCSAVAQGDTVLLANLDSDNEYVILGVIGGIEK